MKIKSYIAKSWWINLLASVVIILTLSAPLGSVQAVPPAIAAGQGGGITGVSWTGAAGVSETTGQIMARQAQLAGKSPSPVTLHPSLRLNPANKTGAGPLIQGPVSGPAVMNAPQAAFTPSTSFDGPGSTANFCGTPPDTMGAVGPTQFIVFVNCNIVSYNKATGVADGVLATTPNTFFASVRSQSVSDPHIRYDRLTQRWFLVIIDTTFPNNRVLIAVSNTATITGATVWTFFFFQSAVGTHTNCLADYPTPGIDANAMYIGVNQFCGPSLATASYSGSDGYVVQKSSLLGGGPIHVTGFQSMTDMYTPQGVDNAAPGATEGYFLGGSVNFWNRINLTQVSNPGSLSPTITTTSITTANQGSPSTQPHLGNTGGANGNLDGSDNRPFSATLRDGQLWTAMNVGAKVQNGVCVGTGSITGATRDAIFWWQIQNIASGATPQIVQSGMVCDTAATNPSFFSYGTIAPNGQGHAALGYTIAGAANFTEPGVSLRLASDPAGTLPTSFISPVGTHSYNPIFDDGSVYGRRWGDYSYTSLDPCDDMTFWTIQEYANPNDQYRERVIKLLAPPPATPVAANPAALNTGQASVSVVITGASSAGSGFYDTPSSLSGESCRKRISATVSNGVTVNSLTFTDPTHLTLNLDTSNATPGLATVTIFNPDGQSQGAAVLQINAPLIATSTLLVPSPSPAVFGQAVSLTATVSGSGGTPSGSVSFFDGSSLLGSGSLSGGVATFSTNALAVGPHANLTAVYAGDSSFAGSTSPAASLTVNKASSASALAAAPNPVVFGQTVTLTATVSVLAPGAGTPTGSVSFFDGSSLLGSGSLSGGVATFSTNALPVGSRNLTAQYNGDSSFTGSISPPKVLTIQGRQLFIPLITK